MVASNRTLLHLAFGITEGTVRDHERMKSAFIKNKTLMKLDFGLEDKLEELDGL
jgi:hypothetical protein